MGYPNKYNQNPWKDIKMMPEYKKMHEQFGNET